MTSKEKYRTYCKDNDHINIFQQPWWLDAVCGEENWDVCIAEEQGILCGVLPYWRKKKLFFSYITMPHLTLYFNPILHNPYTHDIIKKQSFEKKIIYKLIDQLPQHDWINLQANRLISWQPFYWKGFQQTTRYAYGIESPEADEQKLIQSFSKNVRKEIKKCKQEIEVKKGLCPESFMLLVNKTFSRQNKKSPVSLQLLKIIKQTCLTHQCGDIWYAIDESGSVHCASWVVWDQHILYFLISSGDPAYRKSGAKFLLYMRMIQLAAEKGLQVSCSGSMIENIAYVFRQLGAQPKPYHSIFRVCSFCLKSYFFITGKKP